MTKSSLPGAIQEVWGRIFQEWFPATGYQHAGGPELEVYPPGDTGSDDYRCEIYPDYSEVIKNRGHAVHGFSLLKQRKKHLFLSKKGVTAACAQVASKSHTRGGYALLF
ncbi:MAG: AraC family transcriptional regulator [Bacilli bacterium]|nr:AraC family transcriptional regulator [Bacilli bacterium]